MHYRLRAALPDDREFCKQLYVESMLPIMLQYPGWSRERLEKNFDDYFQFLFTRIIEISEPCGWVQVEVKATELLISFLYLSPDRRGYGMGSHIVRGIQQQAVMMDKPCTIRCVKANVQALDLYKRLGFRIVSEDNLKYFMEAVA